MSISTASNSLTTENPSDQIGRFYAWNRDYFLKMISNDKRERSGMLNFGLWNTNTQSVFEAQENLLDEVVKHLGHIKSSANGLDIGCGIGGAGIRLAQEHNIHLTCLDFVSEHIELAQASAQKSDAYNKLTFEIGSAMNMPFGKELFDFSYCIESSFHYEDKSSFFEENYRVLKNDGVAVIADFTCSNCQGVTFRNGNYLLSVDEMKILMEESGFKVKKIISIGDQVFHPIREHFQNSNQKKNSKLIRYWDLLLRNYENLFDRGQMGYEIFVLSK